MSPRRHPPCLRRLALLALAMGLTLSTASESDARRSRTARAHHADMGLPEAIATFETLPQHLDRTEAWIGHVLGQLSDWAVWHERQSAEATVVLGAGWNNFLAAVDPGGVLPRVDMSARQVLVCVPVAGEQTSEFGVRYHPILRRKKMHKGIDFGADRGSPVRAAAPGRVVYARRKGSYGRLVIIDHGLGVETRYAHLDKVHAVEGEFVGAEALIGRVGATGRATGPHLHFEVRQFGRAIDPRRAYATAPTWPVAD